MRVVRRAPVWRRRARSDRAECRYVRRRRSHGARRAPPRPRRTTVTILVCDASTTCHRIRPGAERRLDCRRAARPTGPYRRRHGGHRCCRRSPRPHLARRRYGAAPRRGARSAPAGRRRPARIPTKPDALLRGPRQPHRAGPPRRTRRARALCGPLRAAGPRRPPGGIGCEALRVLPVSGHEAHGRPRRAPSRWPGGWRPGGTRPAVRRVRSGMPPR